MRLLVLAFTVLLIGAAPVDFTRVVSVTPEGGFRQGNPDARVKLVEYASLTCSHCRDFHLEGSPALTRDFIRTGLVTYEIRNLVLNGPDVAASVLARCDGPSRYFKRVDEFYKAQAQWTAPFARLTAAQSKRLSALPAKAQVGALAVAGGLDGFVAGLGMPRATFDKCLANPALTQQLDRISTGAATLSVRGTPTFFVNGAQVDGNSWSLVEPALRAALAPTSEVS